MNLQKFLSYNYWVSLLLHFSYRFCSVRFGSLERRPEINRFFKNANLNRFGSDRFLNFGYFRFGFDRFGSVLNIVHTLPSTDNLSAVSQNGSRSTTLSNQPSDGISKVLFGGQITDEEAESLNKRKQCYEYKLKEMTGSSIFGADGEDATSESGMNNVSTDNRTSVRIVQQALNGISQISFSTDERVSPKKPFSVPEVAKQRELGGTLDSDTDSKVGKQLSNAKSKELSGNDIFGPPSEIVPRSISAAQSMGSNGNRDMGEPAPRVVRTSVRVSNPAGGQSNILFGEEPDVKTTKKIHNQKFAELTGNNIFKRNVPAGSAEKSLSDAKLKEMSGSDIFADGKVESREHFAGVRKPPGGESSIALI